MVDRRLIRCFSVLYWQQVKHPGHSFSSISWTWSLVVRKTARFGSQPLPHINRHDRCCLDDGLDGPCRRYSSPSTIFVALEPCFAWKHSRDRPLVLTSINRGEAQGMNCDLRHPRNPIELISCTAHAGIHFYLHIIVVIAIGLGVPLH